MTEGTHVAAVVEKIALSHPDISIRLIQNNQNKLYTSGNNNLKDLIYTVFGREITSNLLSVDAVYEGIHITGFIGKPVIARSNRNYENYFVNGRYVRSNIISKAIEEAYKPYMMQHKYPFTMLHLSIDPETLDVNVHPTKMELRFSDGEYVFNRTLEAVGEALAHKELIPQVTLDEAAKKRQEDAKSGERSASPDSRSPLRSAGRAVWTREICLPETGRHLPVLILCSKRQRLHRDPVSPGHLFSARKLPAGSMLIKRICLQMNQLKVRKNSDSVSNETDRRCWAGFESPCRSCSDLPIFCTGFSGCRTDAAAGTV